MVAFFSALGAWALGVLSKDAVSLLVNYFTTLWANYQANQSVENQAQADETQLSNAQTPGDKDAAATKINNDTFGGGTT